MKAFVQTTDKNIQKLKNATMSNSRGIQELKNATNRVIQELKSYVANIERQIGQLANQVGEKERGKFPSQPAPNPKGQFNIGSSSNPTHRQEHVKAITTLRSGKQLYNQVATLEEASDTAREEENQAKPITDIGPDIVIPSIEDQSKKYVPRVLYLERLIAPKKSSSTMTF